MVFRTPHLVEGRRERSQTSALSQLCKRDPCPEARHPGGERRKGAEKPETQTVGCMGWVGNGRGPGFESLSCHWLAVWLGTSHVPSLNFHYLCCKMGHLAG